MFFKGIQKNSFIDYPNNISIVLFTGGCNFKCPYCHNGHLVRNEGDDITEDEIISFLEKRKELINHLVISGGEPTLHEGLPCFIRKAKEMNLNIKLDTNGTNPKMIAYLIDNKLIDYVAMDIKNTFVKYSKITLNDTIALDKITRSISIIADAKRQGIIDAEFRTTVCEPLLTKQDIVIIANTLNDLGVKYYIQNYTKSENVLGNVADLKPFDNEVLKVISANFDFIVIR